jgi:hypothetical protein
MLLEKTSGVDKCGKYIKPAQLPDEICPIVAPLNGLTDR